MLFHDGAADTMFIYLFDEISPRSRASDNFPSTTDIVETNDFPWGTRATKLTDKKYRQISTYIRTRTYECIVHTTRNDFSTRIHLRRPRNRFFSSIKYILNTNFVAEKCV